MSFSQETKQELSKINNLANKEQVKYELIGYLVSVNTSVEKKSTIRYATENEYNINRFSKLLNNLNIDYKIDIEGKIFVIKFNIKNKVLNLNELIKNESNTLNETNLSNIKSLNIINSEILVENLNEEQKKSLIRGVFLGSGSINNPERKYHLEIVFSNEEYQEILLHILKSFNFNFKKLKRNNKPSIYIKDGEEISNFLALVGANKSVLQFEDIRVKKEMKGKVNRLVNCKTANLNKTINASIEQIEAIKKLQSKKIFNKLDDNLKEIAILRLENPDIPLSELGKKLKIPVGKSGVNYRLKKIIDIANEI